MSHHIVLQVVLPDCGIATVITEKEPTAEDMRHLIKNIGTSRKALRLRVKKSATKKAKATL